jgi:ABC-type sugar transport system ATPase subunit
MSGLQLRQVTKRFGAKEVLAPLDLVVENGELVVLLGPSGCGKTTVLRLVAGLEVPTSGEILIGGREVTHLPPAQRNVAMVFQNYALYPHMTVAENLAFPLKLRGLPRQAWQQQVREVAEVLGIGHVLDAYPRELSGGQRQRVALGRAMVRKPEVFLFDEPLSNVDAKLRVQMRAEIAKLQRQLGTTTIYVTHDQVEAMTLGQRIAVMKDGRLLQVGRPMEVYRFPADTFVASFIGSPPMNLFPATLLPGARQVRLADHRWALPEGAFREPLPEGPVLLGLRPECLRAGTPGQPGFHLAVEVVENLGANSFVGGYLAGSWCMAAVAPGANPAVGELVPVSFRPEDLYLFSPEGRRLFPLPPSS